MTVYEYIFIILEVVAAVALVLIPVIRKKVSKDIILRALCVVSVFSAAYSILTYGQIFIHSDTATAILLSESIVRHHNFFPATWNYANGEIWVLGNHLFSMLPSLLIGDKSLARVIGSLICVICALICVVYQSKKMFKNNSWLLSVPLLTVFLFGENDMTLYQAAYTGLILWLTLSNTLLYEVYRNIGNKQCKKYLCIHGILMILLTMGGSRILAELTIPTLCTYLIFIYLEIKSRNQRKIEQNDIKKIKYMVGAILIPSVIGIGIYVWLRTWHNMGDNILNEIIFADSIAAMGDNIGTTLYNFFECFGYTGGAAIISTTGFRNVISLTMCTIICFIVPWLQARRIKEESEAVQLFCIFGLIHNLIMIIMSVCMGKLSVRYLLSSVFVFVIISARYIYVYWIHQESVKQYVWTGLFVMATLIECVGLVKGSISIGWADMLSQEKEFNQELMSRGLTKGYATYWNAYSNEIYSDLQIRYGGVYITETDIKPREWLVDNEVFESEDTDTFLLLSAEENAMIGQNLSNICGEPIECFVMNQISICGDEKNSFPVEERYVYVFDHDIVNDMEEGVSP